MYNMHTFMCHVHMHVLYVYMHVSYVLWRKTNRSHLCYISFSTKEIICINVMLLHIWHVRFVKELCIISTSTVNASVIIHKIKYSMLQKQFFHVHRNKWMPNYTCCYGQNWSELPSWLSVIEISVLIQITY